MRKTPEEARFPGSALILDGCRNNTVKIGLQDVAIVECAQLFQSIEPQDRAGTGKNQDRKSHSGGYGHPLVEAESLNDIPLHPSWMDGELSSVCWYPSWSTVNKEKNRTDQRASLRGDTRETQQINRFAWCQCSVTGWDSKFDLQLLLLSQCA